MQFSVFIYIIYIIKSESRPMTIIIIIICNLLYNSRTEYYSILMEFHKHTIAFFLRGSY